MIKNMISENIFNWKKNEVYHDIIDSLIAALEAKDNYTKGHSQRVADMTYYVAKLLGIRRQSLEDIHMAAHMHDIGKIGVPDIILNKTTPLNSSEWNTIRTHPQIGYDILFKSRRLNNIAKIVLHHHERWDGEGYPSRLCAEDIPLGSRIIAICDSIDAMTSKRPYREPLTVNECRIEILKNEGKMFDPEIIKCVDKNWERIMAECFTAVQ
ncbi:HD-GYP domain-containing protein [Clostridium grantii]|uniref:HD domain-containing protein n=1 Tax=Clostridium grantii DSM 8605 TaxID=1121316 RepID=A0A1M5XV08_9CLOT|nr:HD-GYP domain-containing protein [Clostridium grantii]SHI03559.1 HD domain-containing protein [Clostridium grantii DSM 8605]